MTMSYDGELVMPSSYAVMDTEEMAYYNFSLFLKVASAVGVGVAANVWGSVSNGIDIENGLDTRRVSGLAYYQVYRAVYAAGPTFI